MLKFIGTGSAFNTEMGNNSAYYKSNDTLFLFDCGETAFARMKQLNLFDDVQKVFVAITHMHSDHAGSLGSLVAYLNIFKDIKPKLILTNEDSFEEQQENLARYLELGGVDGDEYEFVKADGLEGALQDLQRVELVEVKHSGHLTCYAVELYFEDKTIYYTGDHNDKEYLTLVAKSLKEDDIVYTDCTNRDYEGRVHITLDELCEIFDEKTREQVFCMHFDSYGSYSEARSLGFKTANKELTTADLLRQMAGRK